MLAYKSKENAEGQFPPELLKEINTTVRVEVCGKFGSSRVLSKTPENNILYMIYG